MNIIREESSTTPQNSYALLTNHYNEAIINLKSRDNSLYRTESNFHVSSNDPLIFGYNGVTYSGSTYSKELHTFLEKLGIRKYHVKVEDNLENTKVVDMLLGIKYCLSLPVRGKFNKYDLEYEGKFVEIYKNPYSLSLGYAVNKNIFNTNMENTNTFMLQNELIKNITNIEDEVYTKYTGEIKESYQGMEKVGTKYIKVEEEAKIVYEIESENNDNMYIYMVTGSDNNMKVYINGEETVSISAPVSNEMVNVGKREKGEKIKIEIEPKR